MLKINFTKIKAENLSLARLLSFASKKLANEEYVQDRLSKVDLVSDAQRLFELGLAKDLLPILASSEDDQEILLYDYLIFLRDTATTFKHSLFLAQDVIQSDFTLSVADLYDEDKYNHFEGKQYISEEFFRLASMIDTMIAEDYSSDQTTCGADDTQGGEPISNNVHE